MTIDTNDQAAMFAEMRAEIQALRNQLTVATTPDPKTPRLKYALDGGPLSDGHKFLKLKPVATMKINRNMANGSSRDMVINASDFNPNTDEDLTPKPAAPRSPAKTPAAPTGKRVRKTKITRKKLEGMELAEMLALPIAADIEDLPDSVEGVIDAILDAS